MSHKKVATAFVMLAALFVSSVAAQKPKPLPPRPAGPTETVGSTPRTQREEFLTKESPLCP